MAVPEFVVIGHLVKDVDGSSWRPGGTVTYAAAQAARLGLRVGVVTRASREVDSGVIRDASVHCVPSAETTTFENRYEKGVRVQHVWARSTTIEAEDVPKEWRGAAIVLIGPVLREASPALAGLFPRSLVGLCAQGWLREVDDDGLVAACAWDARLPLEGIDIIFASDDDLGGDSGAVEDWRRRSKIVAITGGRGGARVYNDGRWRNIEAFPHYEVEPTGAGDVFAAAFMIGLKETNSVPEVARFAGAAAGLSVEGEGTANVATRAQIERVLAEHPEVVLK
jgi:1D-myo-inositol 3-kinase